MPRKTKIIFITVFIIVGIIMLSYYFYTQKTGNSSQQNTLSDYNPFNSSNTTQKNSSDGNTNSDSNNTSNTELTGGEQVNALPKLHQITDFSVAGASFFEDTRLLPENTAPLPGGEQAAPQTVDTPVKGGTKNPTIQPKTQVTKKNEPKFEIVPSLRYVERITGHIYQMYLDTKAVSKISNSTIPSIYEALFDGKAQSVIYRYLSEDNKTISSFMATLGGEKGEFLPSNVIDISLSPDKSKFFYLTETTSGVVGTVRSFNETKKSQVFTSSYTEWLSQWVGPQKIFLTTKASGSENGSVFSMNTTNGTISKLFGGVLGLTTLASPDGSLILYSTSRPSGPQLGIFNIGSHTTYNITAYSLPEKCIWSNLDKSTIYCAIPNNITGLQPDTWYQGLTSFDDHFVKINTTTGEIKNIADSANYTSVDGTHLFLDDKESELYFINKKDSTLWSLDLN